MTVLPRKKMSLSGATLKIVIGIIFLPFIVGIFILIDGIKELNNVTKNNSLNEDCVCYDEKTNTFVFYTLNNECIKIISSIEFELYFAPNNSKIYLCRNNGVNKDKIDLGYCDYTEYRKFNSLLTN